MIKIVDCFLAVFTIPAAFLLKLIRRLGIKRFPWCRKVLFTIGVLPITNHYYEPFPETEVLGNRYDGKDRLSGIDWNVDEQLALLQEFRYVDELLAIPRYSGDPLQFYIENPAFGSGDAEYLYSIIRHKKPRMMVEIGAGHSTLIARMAMNKNRDDDPTYSCRHICIEPYEKPWLEKTGATILRKRVEDVDPSLFQDLGGDDLLFIDSSHVIRSGGDVLHEYLRIMPVLPPGVIVHVHDIFTPNDYPRSWIFEDMRLWNEQYLLEAFLIGNNDWKIIGALNFLKHSYYAELKNACPFLNPEREPGSFYIQKGR
ncbi:class I SAM-dependent methyltransferase [Methylococcus geothermalis]|uniref:Class I SAM-dependent methyltransferase n=1 Tax=Methylococcus geothermalis TaxID=2681310 RepID=A0A858QA53_9GAMM|nr:class I SAM-dependent methyltransferase [Methylococcus geothermalis]QJD30661.1 class I SAM-dependent methyltransferase [Methylococcus geothermalis]